MSRDDDSTRVYFLRLWDSLLTLSSNSIVIQLLRSLRASQEAPIRKFYEPSLPIFSIRRQFGRILVSVCTLCTKMPHERNQRNQTSRVFVRLQSATIQTGRGRIFF